MESFSTKLLKSNFNKIHKFDTIKIMNISFHCSEFTETDLENIFKKKEEKIIFIVERIIDLDIHGKSILRFSFSNINVFNLIISKIVKPKFKIPFIVASYIKNDYFLLTLIKKYFNLNDEELIFNLFKSCIDNNKIEIMYNIIYKFGKENVKNKIKDYDIFDYALKSGSVEIIEFLSFFRKDFIDINSILCRDFNTILYCMKYFHDVNMDLFKNILNPKQVKILRYIIEN